MTLVPRKYCAWCDVVIESMDLVKIDDCPDCACPLQILSPVDPELEFTEEDIFCRCDDCYLS